jgi:hypothetical protein
MGRRKVVAHWEQETETRQPQLETYQVGVASDSGFGLHE